MRNPGGKTDYGGTKHFMRMRPRSMPDAPGYSPSSDIGMVFQVMVRQAMQNLVDDQSDILVAKSLTDLSISKETFESCVKAMAAFSNNVANAEVQTPEEAMHRAGVGAVHFPTMLALLGQLGVESMRAYFYASRQMVDPSAPSMWDEYVGPRVPKNIARFHTVGAAFRAWLRAGWGVLRSLVRAIIRR